MHSMQIKCENITLISIAIILICYECLFIVLFIVYNWGETPHMIVKALWVYSNAQ